MQFLNFASVWSKDTHLEASSNDGTTYNWLGENVIKKKREREKSDRLPRSFWQGEVEKRQQRETRNLGAGMSWELQEEGVEGEKNQLNQCWWEVR